MMMDIRGWFKKRKEIKARKKFEQKLIWENERLSELMNSANSLTKVGFFNPCGETAGCDEISRALRDYCQMKARELSQVSSKLEN